ncbi:MAG: Spy/CpxP family protein refolding chaperone [Armatimonadota bacterium]|nr:Spy/CpxP family protein refolding chaperone [Armatimonadota bacterium]MDR7549688.1 Spy/CpxP family protein refolding chaperone [Armatimonadota bacterium]
MRPIHRMAGVVTAGLVLTVALAAAAVADEPAAVGLDDIEASALTAQAPSPAQPALAPPWVRLRQRLNLTEDQARRVEQILLAHRARTAQLRIDLARARLDAREAMLATTPDRARLEAIARRIGDLQGQLVRARFDMLVDLRSVLTAEQWARLQMLMEGRGRFMRRR